MTSTGIHSSRPLVSTIVRCARSFYELLGNRRKHARAPIVGRIEMTSPGSVVVNTQVCACVDISVRGIGLDCPEAAIPESVVELRSPESGSTRLARVRYCVAQGERYRVGLEFMTGGAGARQ